jgi:YD repeat-containing protein
MDYEKDLLKDVTDNNGRKLTFKYNTSKKLASITGPSGANAEYKFANLDDLGSVKNAWGNTYNYEYDDLHNLVKATWPDKTFVQITYDKNKDWTTSFKDRQGCLESYNYETASDDPKNHYWSNVKKVCGKDVVNESKFEFFHKRRADGVTILHRTVSTINGNTVDVVYHENFGKPLTIKRNSDRVVFEYYDNGQLRSKANNFSKLAFEYDKKSNKVSKAKTVFMDDKGKKVSEKISDFKYDDKGNLTYAQNSDGQKINLTYDPKGRIASIVDQAKKLVKIQYDDRFGKPAIVTRPGLGTIKISYKPTGEIQKADSPDGPQVAVQVASTFNIIAPASNEVFN